MRTAISYSRALIRLSFTRVSARFAVRSPGFLEGAILDWRAGARTRHNRNFNRQQTPTYGPKPLMARELVQASHTRAQNVAFAQVPLTETPPNGVKRGAKGPDS